MRDDYLVKEDDLGKVYDLRIIRRLIRYARPYTLWLLLALLLASLMSISQILLPYLSKVGIDEYIVVKDSRVDISTLSSFEKQRILDSYSSDLIPISEQVFYVRDGVLDPADRLLLERSKAFDQTAYYRLDLTRYTTDSKDFLLRRLHEEKLRVESDLKSNIVFLSGDQLRTVPNDLRSMIRKPDLKGIRNIALTYLVILIGSLGVMFFQVYVMAWVGQRIMFDIRMELFNHIQRLHIRFFSNQPTGRLVTRVSNDVNVLNEVFTSILVEMLKNVLMLFLIIAIMLKLAPNLALIIFSILPPMIAVTWIFKRKMRFAYREVRKKIALINATIAEHLSGIKVIKAFAREMLHFKKFQDINTQAYKANMRELITQSLFSPFVVLLENLGIALILYYGGGQVVQNSITLGTLVAFLSYLSMFFGPVRDIAEKFNIMQSAMASSERIFQIMDIEPEDGDDRGSRQITSGTIRGDIEFENVWFAYNGDDWVLKDVSFSIKAGETIAFVGATGSGKTTIINLLTRFYTIQKGRITVDGHDLTEYERGFLRKSIAMVLQDVFLFSGDIRRNIRLNNQQITDETILNVARKVNAHKFVERLEGGFAHVVKEGGATLSQGQRQLLAFARALAMDPALLILDEATANIDSETEQWIQKGLDQLLKSRTALVVAHRLSTIKKAHKIIVLHKGKVCETGTHRSLLAKQGLYYRLYQLQFKEQEQPAG